MICKRSLLDLFSLHLRWSQTTATKANDGRADVVMDHDICLVVVNRGYWVATSTFLTSQIVAEAGSQMCDHSIIGCFSFVTLNHRIHDGVIQQQILIITGSKWEGMPVCCQKHEHTADSEYRYIKTNSASRKQWRANSRNFKLYSKIHAGKLMEPEY